jgi:diguanylate cyclase (GGDEF)-like protein
MYAGHRCPVRPSGPGVPVAPVGAFSGVTYAVPAGGLTLGDPARCDIPVPALAAEGRAASIRVCGGAYELLTSRPGGNPSSTPLIDGCHLTFGEVVLHFVTDLHPQFAYYLTLEAMVYEDPLTRAGNRRQLARFLEREVSRLARRPGSLSVVATDIDHFRAFNNNHGHACGDHVLRELAELFRQMTRSSDLVARCGGEEFVLALADTPKAGAYELAERVRHAVEQQELLFDGLPYRVTLSLGVASTSDVGPDPEALLVRADEALFEAKRLGRNRVRSWPSADAAEEPFAAVTGPAASPLERAAACLEDGAFDEARRFLADAPDDPAWLVLAGRVLHAEGWPARAAEEHSRALRRDPSCGAANLWRGIALCGLGRVPEALSDLDRAAADPALLALARLARGNALMQTLAFDSALAEYDATLRAAPRLADAHFARGHARVCLGDYAGGVADCDRGFSLGGRPAFPAVLMYTSPPAGGQGDEDGPAAHLVRVGPLGPSTGCRYPLVGGSGHFGLPVEAASAVVERDGDGHSVRALASGGVRVNGREVRVERLRGGDVLSDQNASFLYLAPATAGSFWRQAYRAVCLDQLTGVVNRRYLTNYLAHALPSASDDGRPLALLMLDVDHFKAINSEFGRDAGDEVLREVAAAARAVAGPGSVVARVGGEELVIAAEGVDPVVGRRLAEEVRAAVAGREVRWGTRRVRVTVSVGVAVFRPGDACCGDTLVFRASRGVSQAKAMGRDRVVEA